MSKHIAFFCRFASDGGASIDLYCKNENASKKHAKSNRFFDFSNHPNAQVPISIYCSKHDFGARPASQRIPRKWSTNCTQPTNNAPGVKMT